MTPTHSIPADLLTPLGAYLRLRSANGGSFLLESVERGRLGRNSFVGCGARLVGFDEVERLGVPAVGYVAYDHVARLEPTVPLPADGPLLPESLFIVADTLLRFDLGAGVVEVLAGDPDDLARRLEEPLADDSTTPSSSSGAARPLPVAGALRGDGAHLPGAHRRGRRVPDRPLAAGGAADVGEPARRVPRAPPREPVAVPLPARARRVALVGSSPERLVACENGQASVCPIAGTTAAGEGDAERLLASEKDRAEHVMLVDLGRNDLSRVCTAGSVRVTRSLEVERFSHVTHLVSEVVGELRAGVTPFDVLRACFPAGTVTGAPKIRAMQIISELEGYRRGPYAGAVGYVLPGGTMDTCIALRTIVMTDGVARLQAGAGIVADSDPAAEHRECLAKLAALEAAIDLAEEEYA